MAVLISSLRVLCVRAARVHVMVLILLLAEEVRHARWLIRLLRAATVNDAHLENDLDKHSRGVLEYGLLLWLMNSRL